MTVTSLQVGVQSHMRSSQSSCWLHGEDCVLSHFCALPQEPVDACGARGNIHGELSASEFRCPRAVQVVLALGAHALSGDVLSDCS